jgi:hypothetical protein
MEDLIEQQIERDEMTAQTYRTFGPFTDQTDYDIM